MKNTGDDIKALKDATREAHEAIQGLREVMREAKQVTDTLRTVLDDVIKQQIQERVDAGLRNYVADIKRATDEATDAVFKRYDILTDTLLGTTKAHLRNGESMEDMAERFRAFFEHDAGKPT